MSKSVRSARSAPEVVLEDGVELVSHVVVDGRTRIGAGAKLFPVLHRRAGAAGPEVQRRGPTETVIGPRTQIREHASIHRGTVTGTGVTRIGADCLLMATVHVAHDCEIGEGVIMSNNVVIGGHVEIGDRARIGGAAALLQFVRVGTGAMVGGLTGVTRDITPYCSRLRPARGNAGAEHDRPAPARPRAGAAASRSAPRIVSFSPAPGVFAARVTEARASNLAPDPYVVEMLDFIANPSRHGLITTVARASSEGEG